MERLPELLQAHPYTIQIPKIMGGTSCYRYTFNCVPKNTLITHGTVTIAQVDGKRQTTNHFKLMFHTIHQGILLCTQLGETKLNPPLAIPIEYQPRTKNYVFYGSFAEIRGMFSLNSFEDGFGWLATLFCTNMTVAINSTEMEIICRGLGGYVLNRAEPNHMHLEDEEIQLEASPFVDTPPFVVGPDKSSFLEKP